MTDIAIGRSYETKNYSTSTGTGALSLSISDIKALELEEVRIHVGVAPAAVENLTITIDALAGSAYDTLIKTIAMSGVTNYIWVPDKPCLCVPGDAIAIAWTNSDGRTWGLTYVYRRIN